MNAARALAVACTMLVWTTGTERASVHLEDVTASAGLLYRQWVCDGCPQGTLEPYVMTGGACVADFDGDGWTDLFATRMWAPDLLFLNDGDGTFTEDAAARGAALPGPSNGAACADVDDDSDVDVYVTTVDGERSYLLLNDGTGRFDEAAAAWGVDRPETRPLYFIRSGMSASFGDYDLDGWLDLHTSEWSAMEIALTRLYRNVAGAGFEDVTEAAAVDMTDVWAFTSKFADLDGDGWPELLQAGDFGTSRLFRNDRDGTFTNVTDAARVGTDENGMGSAVGDLDNDGDLDWFVTSIYDPLDTCRTQPCGWSDSGNRLYGNDGRGRFADATDAAGVRNGWWGWAATFLDIDNDGDLDLAQANGFDLPQTRIDATFENDPLRLWINDGRGVMSERSAELGFSDDRSSKGLLSFDYDADGDLDLFVVNNLSTPVLYRNDGGDDNAWLTVALRGVRSNRFGVGARIWLRAEPSAPVQLREMSASSNFLAQDETVAHFGLGPGVETVQRVLVEWPVSGYVQDLRHVEARQRLVVWETAGTGDSEADLDVDLDDLSTFVSCLTGPGQSFVEDVCVAEDFDFDGDVDLVDYAGLQVAFTGTTAGARRLPARAATARILPSDVAAAAATRDAPQLTLRITSSGRTTVAAPAGSRVPYAVAATLSDDDNEGLAMFAFDLLFPGGEIPPAETPVRGPMQAFARDLGLTNPEGYGGTSLAGELVQVGGAQNSVGNDGAAGRPPFPVGPVVTDVAHGGEILVRGEIVVPEAPGVYPVRLVRPVATAIRSGEDGRDGYWRTDRAVVEVTGPLWIEAVTSVVERP